MGDFDFKVADIKCIWKGKEVMSHKEVGTLNAT